MADESDKPKRDKPKDSGRLGALRRAVGMKPGQAPNHPAGWTKETIKLPSSHQWKCSDGHLLLVANRGQLRFEYPQGWHNYMEKGTIKLSDVPPPKDECRIQVSIIHTPGFTPSHYHELPLLDMMQKCVDRDLEAEEGEEKPERAFGWERLTPVQELNRLDGVGLVWCESRWIDKDNGMRPVLCRQFLVRATGFHAFVTFDYYESRAEEFRPVWQHLLDTMRCNAPVSLTGDELN